MRNTLIDLVWIFILIMSIIVVSGAAKQSTTSVTIELDTETLDNIKYEANEQKVTPEKYISALVYGALADIFVNTYDESESQKVIKKFLEMK